MTDAQYIVVKQRIKEMNKIRTNKTHIVLLFAIIFAGCNGTQKHSETNVKRLSINWDNISDVIDYSPMVEDSVSIIPLETKEEGLIGEVTKLIHQNNLIYIADNLSKSIFVFDMSGKLQTKIHAVGNGPGEYVNISYFTVHKNNMVILDHYACKLLFYDASGKFIRDKTIVDIWGTDLFCIGDKLYLPNDGSRSKSGCYHLFTVDLANSDEIEKHLPFDERKNNQGWGTYANHAQSGNEALLCFWPFIELYSVENGDVSLSYQLDFGDKFLPKQYVEGDGPTALRTAIRDHYVTGIRHFWQSDQYIFLYFSDSENTYIAIYDKRTGEIRTTEQLKNIKIGNLPLQIIGEGFIIQNEQIIQCYSADYWNHPVIRDLLESKDAHFYSEDLKQKFLKLAQTDGAESNPIILIQNLKK